MLSSSRQMKLEQDTKERTNTHMLCAIHTSLVILYGQIRKEIP